MPYEKGRITKEEFNEFKKWVTSDEFKARTEKAKYSKSFDEYPHNMGPTSYAQNDIKWEKLGYYSSSSTCTSVGSCTTIDNLSRRTQRWMLGRCKKDENGNLIVPNEKTQKAVEKIQKVKDGEFVPYRTDDVLNRALDRKEHGGRVLGCDGRTKRRDVFGPCHRSSLSQVEKDAEMKRYVSNFITEKLATEVPMHVASHVAVMHDKVRQYYEETGGTIPSRLVEMFTGAANSPVVDKPHPKSSCQSGGVDPFVGLEGKYPCQLALMVNMERVIVAYGIADFSASINHHKPVSPENVVVNIDDCEKNYALFSLPISTGYMENIGDAVGSFTQWPKHLVELKKDKKDKASNLEVQPGKRKHHESGNATNESAVSVKKPFQPEKSEPPISDKCKRMKSVLVGYDNLATIEFQADIDDFCLSKDASLIVITKEDVDDILLGKWLSVSVIEVFMMALKNQYIQNFDEIGFMRPGVISSLDCQRNKVTSTVYMSKVIQEFKTKRFIFCPYWEGQHWILIVISVVHRQVYTFDPMRLKCNNRILIKPLLDRAFLTYVQLEPKRLSKKGLTWHSIQCAQQLGSRECGYFVMRYMFEIVLHHRDSKNLIHDFTRIESYTEAEISEVLDIWAKYCVSTIMSS
ncbi:hypothetical protein M5689_015773 [Euphorbia peplus]|nr:hypothetical protein M5689_015773 [Euphorbia peplus]